jgi:hypothetical protein
LAGLLALSATLGGVGKAQEYAGVVPGSAHGAVATSPSGARGKPVVTWPGFQVLLDGGTRVFVQTSGPVQPELQAVGSNWQVVIPGVALPRGNVRLPLDTHFFNTPVNNARLTPKSSHTVALVLEMRAKVTPRLRTESGPNGFFYTYVEFPAGTYESAQPSANAR